MIHDVVSWALLFAVLVPAAIIGIVYISVMGMKDPEKCLARATGAEEEDHRVLIDRHEQWAAGVGFVPCGCFVFKGPGARVFIPAWQHSREPRFFCVYDMGNRLNYDFVTEFGGDCALTTGNTREAGLLPRPPGDYCQSFPGQPLEALYERHLTAEKFLIERHHLTLEPLTATFPEMLVKGMGRQVAYVRSLALWPLRGPWWWFVKKGRLVNRSVEEQIRRGLVAPPRTSAAGRPDRARL